MTDYILAPINVTQEKVLPTPEKKSWP